MKPADNELVSRKNLLTLLELIWDCQNVGNPSSLEIKDTVLYVWEKSFEGRTYDQFRQAVLLYLKEERFGKFPTPGQLKPYMDRIPKTANQIYREHGITEEMIKNATPAIIEDKI